MAYVERQRGGRQRVPMGSGTRAAAGLRSASWSTSSRAAGSCASSTARRSRSCATAIEVFALGNLCPHRGGQIGDGHVEDGKAICPLHAWDFDLQTGISPFNPADSLPTYPARVATAWSRSTPSRYRPPRPARRCTWARGPGAARPTAGCPGAPPGRGWRAVRGGDGLGAERARDARPAVPLVRRARVPAAQLDRLPLLGDVPVDTSVVLGTRAKKPLTSTSRCS